jgi:hypothetical protein
MLVGFGVTGGRGGETSAESRRSATVGWYGDSITQGACSSSAPPARLDVQLAAAGKPGYVVTNAGVSGETAHQISARAQAGSATACIGEPCGHYVVQGAVNTLKSAAHNALSVAAVAQLALHGASASSSGTCATGTPDACGTMDTVDYLHSTHPGARIFAIGVLPYASCDAGTCPSLVDPGERAREYNRILRVECASRPWLTCVMPYDTFKEPGTDNLSSTYACEADYIHLNDVGSEQLASEVLNSGRW